GWGSGTILGLFGAAVVILLVWGFFELRVSQPLVDLRTTARRQVLFTNLASIAVGFAMFAMSLVIPQILQLPEATGYGLGQSLLAAGLVMAPSGLVMMALAPVSAAVTKAKGPKVTLMIGALIVAAGYGLNIVLMDEVWHFILVSCVIGAGIGFTYGSMPALIMGAVPASETGAANSLNTLMRSIGTSVASAVAGVILAQMTTTFGGTALPSEDGFKAVLAIGVGAALLAFVVASFIPRQRPLAAAGEAPATAAKTPPSASPDGTGAPAVTTAAASVGATADASAPSASVTLPGPRKPLDLATVQGDGRDGGWDDGWDDGASGIPVRGYVRGAESAPVSGAAVTLISLEGRQLGRAVAQGDGSYGVQAPGAGSYVLIAAADGYQPQASTVVVADAPVTYDVLLSGTSGLAGVVRSADSGVRVAGAVVIVTDVRGDVLATGETDAMGEFTVSDLVPGTVTLAVNSPKHRPMALPVEVGGAGATRVEVELQPGAHVRGTVRGAGAPLSDARVTLVDAAGNVVATTTTGIDGAYAFSDLDSGEYTVMATGYPPKATGVTVSGGGVDDHDIELAHEGAPL
ncbi:MFS transporter, partial [Streptomyces sp. HC44]